MSSVSQKSTLPLVGKVNVIRFIRIPTHLKRYTCEGFASRLLVVLVVQ